MCRYGQDRQDGQFYRSRTFPTGDHSLTQCVQPIGAVPVYLTGCWRGAEKIRLVPDYGRCRTLFLFQGTAADRRTIGVFAKVYRPSRGTRGNRPIGFGYAHRTYKNRNRFVLGSSGTGKSYAINAICQQYLQYNMDVVIVDVGHSYSGLCSTYGGKYI